MGTKRERQAEARKKVMPILKRLAKTYGLSVVSGALARLKAYEREVKRLDKLEAEVKQRRARLA